MKKGFAGFFCYAESLVLSLNKRKHRSSNKQANQGVTGFFSRVSVDLAIDKRKRTSAASVGGGENFFYMSMLIEFIVCAGAVVSLVTTEEVR